MAELPQKDQYRLNEVCEFTDTQPYVLRFWESEFPQLNPARSRSGQPVYSREDIDLVQRIKQLLYEDEYTLADARKKLEGGESAPRPAQRKPKQERARRESPKAAAVEPEAAPTPARADSARPGPRPLPLDDDPGERIEKARYDAAVEEIEHLRYKLKEADREVRLAEDARDAALAKAERAAGRIEQLIGSLEPPPDAAP